jgi:hypothetical protein
MRYPFIYILGVFVLIYAITYMVAPEIDIEIKRNLRYASYILRHKYFVIKAGLIVHAPLYRLLVHDMSKFLPVEWFAYKENFQGPKRNTTNERFRLAWLKHIHRNAHHWEHWCKFYYGSGGGNIKLRAFKMPESYVREMVADWLAAGRAIHGHYCAMAWYAEHKYKILLHHETRHQVEMYLALHAVPLEGKL